MMRSVSFADLTQKLQLTFVKIALLQKRHGHLLNSGFVFSNLNTVNMMGPIHKFRHKCRIQFDKSQRRYFNYYNLLVEHLERAKQKNFSTKFFTAKTSRSTMQRWHQTVSFGYAPKSRLGLVGQLCSYFCFLEFSFQSLASWGPLSSPCFSFLIFFGRHPLHLWAFQSCTKSCV